MILGAATSAGTNNTIISGRTAADTWMQWDGTNRSAVQAIGKTLPTLGANTLCLTYAESPNKLIATIQNGAGVTSTVNILDASSYALVSSLINGSNIGLGRTPRCRSQPRCGTTFSSVHPQAPR